MRTKRVFSLLIVGALPLVAVACASRGQPNPPLGVDHSGTWLLDREASDDFASAMANRQGGQVVRRGPGGGGGVGGGMGGGRMITREAVQGDMEALGKAPNRFVLEQADGAVRLSFPDGRNVLVRTTGDGRNSTWFDGVDVEVKADWRDSALRIERATEYVTAVDTYARDPDTSRLVVTTTLSGGMGGDVTLRRYYDPEPAS